MVDSSRPIASKSCPDRFIGNTTVSSRITGGALRVLESGDLSVSLLQATTLSGEVNGTCTGSTTGTLKREASN